MSGEPIPVPEILGSIKEAREAVAKALKMSSTCVTFVIPDGLIIADSGPIPDDDTQVTVTAREQ